MSWRFATRLAAAGTVLALVIALPAGDAQARGRRGRRGVRAVRVMPVGGFYGLGFSPHFGLAYGLAPYWHHGDHRPEGGIDPNIAMMANILQPDGTERLGRQVSLRTHGNVCTTQQVEKL